MPRDTALHDAAKEGDIEVVNALLAEGADINKKDNHRWTPLHYASVKGHLKVVNALLEKGADVNKRDNKSLTPLHSAVMHGQAEVVNALLAKGVDVNALCEFGTPLCLAALYNRREIVNILFDNGAKVNCGDYRGKAPLHFAADKGRIEVVNALIAAKGIDVNAVDQDGLTPLHCAAYSGNTDLVKILIAKGANPLLNSYYYEGDSVTEEIKQLLKEAEEKINRSASKLFWAVFTDEKEEAESIIESSKKECNLAAILRSGSRIKYLFSSKEEAEELAKKDNKDIIKEIWQKQERQAIFKGVTVGILAGLIGGTIAIALFMTDVIPVEPPPIFAAAVIVGLAVFAAVCIGVEEFRAGVIHKVTCVIHKVIFSFYKMPYCESRTSLCE